MKEKVSIQQISEATGFSKTTVFNVLNNRGGASKETVRTIMQAAQEMNYSLGGSAKKIKLVVYKDSGTVVDDTPFFSQLFAGIENECRANGYSLEIAYLYNSSEDYALARSRILSGPADGLILLGTEMSKQTFADFEQSGIPLVLCDNRFLSDKVSCVAINNKDTVEAAVEYLIACGHREIGYLKGYTRINNFRDRADGLRAALGKNGLSDLGDYTIQLRPSMETAYQDMKSWLAIPRQLPTAFFADNDLIAFGAMRALQEAGYRIPEDVSVLGFDDMPFCEVSSPPLTTVRVDKTILGRKAVQVLLERIQSGQQSSVATITLIGAKLVRRDSVRDLRSKR